LLRIVEQEQQTQNVKISNDPLFDPKEIRIKFLKILNKICLENSHGKKGLVLDPEIENVIDLICMYYNKEIEFENKGYSLNKGIWLCGNFGTGKTLIMLAYKELVKTNVGFKSCVEMNGAFLKKDEFTNQRAGFDGIKAFTNKEDKVQRIFDDLGEEETTLNDYGNKICVMAHILSERYKSFKSGCITHITTNLTKKEISEVYGGRIESRVMEMFNIITLGSKITSTDYRKL